MPDSVTVATVAQLATRIKKTTDDPEVVHAFDTAVELVNEALTVVIRPVPAHTRKECVLSVGHAVYDRTKSSHGVGQLTTIEGGTPVRAPRDPKASIRTILADYLPLGFA